MARRPIIGVIADLHDHLVNFAAFQKKTAAVVTEIWIAGDLGTPETFQELCQMVHQPLMVVAGNLEEGHHLDRYELLARDAPNLTWSSVAPLTFQRQNQTIAMFHFPHPARAYAQNHPNQLIVSGHTHRPNLERIGSSWHLNPGTLSGEFSPPTYALVDLSALTFTLHRLYA